MFRVVGWSSWFWGLFFKKQFLYINHPLKIQEGTDTPQTTLEIYFPFKLYQEALFLYLMSNIMHFLYSKVTVMNGSSVCFQNTSIVVSSLLFIYIVLS